MAARGEARGIPPVARVVFAGRVPGCLRIGWMTPVVGTVTFTVLRLLELCAWGHAQGVWQGWRPPKWRHRRDSLYGMIRCFCGDRSVVDVIG